VILFGVRSDRQQGIYIEAQDILKEAKAIKECNAHSEILYDNGNSEAVKLAYAIGTNKFKNGELSVFKSLEELCATIKEVYDEINQKCPRCEN
jgi:hypothetical protein